MKLYIVRHGETNQNRANIIQGQQDGELSTLGIQQSERLSQRLSSTPFDVVYCSDLKRARDTLAPFLKVAPREVLYDQAIRERAFGELEGMEGKVFLSKLSVQRTNRIDYRPPGGENFHDLKERTDKFLETIREQHFGKSVLLLSHGGTIRTMLANLLNKSVDELLRIEVRNTSVSTIFFGEDGEIVEHKINCCEHLEGLELCGAFSQGVDAIQEPSQ